MKKIPYTRRSFIKAATASASALAFPQIITSNALGANGRPAASNRIVMGGLAIGSRGGAVLGEFLRFKEIQVVAVNDVRRSQLQGQQRRVNNR